MTTTSRVTRSTARSGKSNRTSAQPLPARYTRVSSVVFAGVEGYHFEDDAFGNVILDLEAVAITWFVSRYRDELADSFRRSGAPGTWASDLDAAPQALSARGVQAFVLSFSIGLSGWALAKEASVIP